MFSIELKNISKNFGKLKANDDISFSVKKNSVHCLLGENGAGKSTLMKILFGVYLPDSGEIFINNEKSIFHSPLDAIKAGIGMLYQHFMLIDDFTVMENVILGYEFVKNGKIDFEKSKTVITNLIEKYNFDFDVNKKVSELNISQQQKVELLKILYRDSEIIIFDEPTAVLSPVEVKEFYKIINNLLTDGKTIILITHKLNEVMESADEITVLRKGKSVFNTEKKNIKVDELGKYIIGDVKIDFKNIDIEKQNRVNSDLPLLKLKNIYYAKSDKNILNGINLNIKGGIIYGICGVEGNGQNEIIDILFGITKNFKGEFLKNTDNISLVPDDRFKKGMIKEYSPSENVILRKKNSFIKKEYLDSVEKKLISEYDVKIPEIDNIMNNMSGGNQQKAIVAREIDLNNDVIIFSHPTRGVDIKSASYIHNRIISEKYKGKGILLISSDIEELFFLSDFIYILFNGEFVKQYSLNEYSDEIAKGKEHFIEKIGKMMIGISNE